MPLHRHECESCGHRFRILVTHGTENDAPTCPACGGVSTRRLMPLVAVQFKGSGYYKTDHGRKGQSRPDNGGGETKAGDSGETESSEESEASDKPKAGRDSKDSSTSTKSSSSK